MYDDRWKGALNSLRQTGISTTDAGRSASQLTLFFCDSCTELAFHDEVFLCGEGKINETTPVPKPGREAFCGSCYFSAKTQK